MKNFKVTRLFSLLLAICILGTTFIAPVSAAQIADATVNMAEKCNLTIYMYDWTNAAKDGIWNQDSYVSTGQYDENVNDILGKTAKQGAADKQSTLGNNEKSNGYAIKGVEYTYLQVADLYQFTESENDNQSAAHIEVLYKFDKAAAEDLLAAIGLEGGKDSYANANALDSNSWFYQSDVLNKALADSLSANSTTVKNALETYVKANNGTAMDLTDENGRSVANNLDVGLYLLVETKVPEHVTNTTNPFFLSLPMTNVNGGGDGTNGNTGSVTDGGHEWLYNVTVYPKNETGIVTLEKTVREAAKDTGKKTEYAHYATASAGDTVEYQIVSKLPTITSAATNIAEYTFQDVLARGLTYDANTPVKVEFFKDAACTDLAATWEKTDDKFDVSIVKNDDGTHTMTIKLTDIGLAEINAVNTSANNSNGSLYAGYSNYTMRITYAATLNSDESMVYGDAGNCNEVVLTWRRASENYLDALIDDCHVYTYGINVTKTFSDGADDQDLFDHVLFKAQNKTDGYYVIAALNEEEGIWYVTGHTEEESAATAMHPVSWNGKKGQLVIKGVENDEYVLTEIETANKYTLLKDDISIVISVADDANRPCEIYSKDTLGVMQNDQRFTFDGGLDLVLANIPQAGMAHNFLTARATVDGNKVTMVADEADTASSNAIAPLSVVNTRGFELPQTGENGARMLPIIGGLIVAFALIALCFVFVPRREKAKK